MIGIGRNIGRPGTVAGNGDHVNAYVDNRVDNGKEVVFESRLRGVISPALAEIMESKPHYHRVMTEWYMVDSGEGTLYRNGNPELLKPNDCVKINPGEVHSVKSIRGLRLFVVTLPKWSPADHLC